MSMTIGNIISMKAFQFGGSKTWSATLTITTAEQNVTVPGLKLGDIVTVNKPTAQAGLGVVGARVSAADTLSITFVNPTVASITSTANEVWTGVAFRPDYIDASATI